MVKAVGEPSEAPKGGFGIVFRASLCCPRRSIVVFTQMPSAIGL